MQIGFQTLLTTTKTWNATTVFLITMQCIKQLEPLQRWKIRIPQVFWRHKKKGLLQEKISHQGLKTVLSVISITRIFWFLTLEKIMIIQKSQALVDRCADHLKKLLPKVNQASYRPCRKWHQINAQPRRWISKVTQMQTSKINQTLHSQSIRWLTIQFYLTRNH